MQVANAINNSIRILFNPRVEDFRLFDFLMVKSDNDRYIAQIVEIYDNKFDSSQNIAKIKLFYKITENNEVMPYDNFTPNRECEIVKIKPKEIENFINQDKKTFIFATNTKNSCSLEIQYNFFNNNPIILADKIENANSISLNLAKNLSTEKNVVIIDSTGILEFENAKKIKASKNFRMPLNYTTIDFIFDKCLSDASLEFQSVCGEIINEIKKFARKQESQFIPFNAFTRVLLEQYKATPYPELKLLLVRLKKYQMDEVFARTKKDNETLFKTIEKNPITILDLSGIEVSWQKAYLEYIIENIEQEIYLITRINDENCDVDLINKIYNQKKNINFIPNVSYNYKKLPSIMQYCKNYILLPSLYQRTDFLDANFALSNLIPEGCIIFGENTDNFLYFARDYELELQEKRKNYRKIALSLIKEDEENTEEQKEEVSKTDSEKLMEELTRFENEKKESENQKQVEDFFEEEISQNDLNEAKETFEEIENPKTTEIQNIQQEEKNDIFEDIFENKASEEEIKKEPEDEFQELNDKIEENLEINEKETNNTEEIKTEEQSFEDILEKENDEVILQEPKEITEIEENKETEEQKTEDNSIIEEEPISQIKTETEEPTIQIESENIAIAENPEESTIVNTPPEEKAQENSEAELVEFGSDNSEIELSDEELDFFQIAKESSIEYEKTNVTVDDIEYKTQNTQDDDDLNLSEIASSSIDNSFEQIIDSKPSQSIPVIEVDENIKINADILEKPVEEKENLPIFKEEIKEDETPVFKVGDIISHKKYGKGTVTKTIKYEQRQLVQVEFEDSGKKLLDPKVADIKLEQ